MWMPSTLGFPAAAFCAACMAVRVLSYVSLISVGNRPVVPKRRCAAAMALMPSTVGVSLNSTSPPPFTCTSMNPGASQASPGSTRTGIDGGKVAERLHVDDVRAFDDDGAVAHDRDAVEDAAGGDGMRTGSVRCAHSVLVTLLRCRGLSTSMSSCWATSTARA